MTTLRIYFEGERAGQQLERSLKKNATAMNAAMMAMANQTAQTIETRGRADISSAGRFSGRWVSGLHAKVTRGGANIRLAVSHDVSYFSVFEYGKLITGRPLLWLPIGGRKGGVGEAGYARNYPGRLFKVTRSGKLPLLLDTESKAVKYVGLPSVRIPRKFHIRDIIREESARMKEVYKAKMAAAS